MNHVLHALVVIAMLLTSGCAKPHVKHTMYTQLVPRTDLSSVGDTYMLPKTKLTISRSEVNDGADYLYQTGLTLENDVARAFSINPINKYGVRTNLSLSKFANTQIVQTATVSVDDKRKEYIGEAFKLLGTLVGVAPTGAPGATASIKYPIEIDTLSTLISENCLRTSCKSMTVADDSALSAVLSVSAVAPDAINIETLVPQLSSVGGEILSSSCRRAVLRISAAGVDDDTVYSFALADPRYIQPIALPTKGTISAHSECGYSVLSEKAELQSDTSVINEFIAQILKLQNPSEEAEKE